MANIIRFGGSASGSEKNPYPQIQNYLPLYWYGDECVENSGGWSLEDIPTSQGYRDNPTKYTLTKNASDMEFNTVTNSGTSTSNQYAIAIQNSIDVTDFTSLSISLSIKETISNTNSGVNLFTIENKSNYIDSDAKGLRAEYSTKEKGNTFSGVLSVDLASLTGNVYVGVNQGHAGGYATTNNLTSTISSVYLTKEDDYLTLASKCGSTATTIEGLLADSAKIFASKDAVQFMVAQCTGDFMVEACRCDNFLNALGASEYAYMVYENEHWAKFITAFANASHKLYLYWEGNNVGNLQSVYTQGWNYSVSSYAVQNPTINYNNDRMNITYTTSSPPKWWGVVTPNKYDLSKYKNFKCIVDAQNSGSYAYVDLFRNSIKTWGNFTRIVENTNPNPLPKVTYTMDLNNINDDEYLGISVTTGATTTYTSSLNIYAVWLES